MPSTDDARQALSAEQALLWLDQIADDRELAPVTSRLATKLALRFSAGEAEVAIGNETAARLLQVGFTTAQRAMVTLRERGHVSSTWTYGKPQVLRPILRREV